MEAFATILDVAAPSTVQLTPPAPQPRLGAAAVSRPTSSTVAAATPLFSTGSGSGAASAACVALAALAVARRAPRKRQLAKVVAAGTAVAEAPATSSAAQAEDADKVAFAKSLFSDVMDIRVPGNLEVFLAVLKGSGYTLLGKDDWRKIGGDMHPFLLPLAVKGDLDGDDDGLEVIGFLVRQPNGAPTQPEEFQVVSQKPRSTKVVQLVAFDVPKYIAKRAEEATFRNEKQDLPVIEATKDVYEVQFKGTDQTALDKWLLLEVGAFPDVYKHLSEEHINNDDAKTGLVIADTMRDAFGTSWGFPHAYCCRVLRDHFGGKGELENRDLEADHCAMRCFTSGYPLWTLEEDEASSLEKLLYEAKMPKLGSLDALRVWYLKRATDDQRAAVRTGSISLGCATMAKAQAIMDAVCCGHKSYAGVRQELRDLYEEVPGCEPLMDMIDYFTP